MYMRVRRLCTSTLVSTCTGTRGVRVQQRERETIRSRTILWGWINRRNDEVERDSPYCFAHLSGGFRVRESRLVSTRLDSSDRSHLPPMHNITQAISSSLRGYIQIHGYAASSPYRQYVCIDGGIINAEEQVTSISNRSPAAQRVASPTRFVDGTLCSSILVFASR